METALIKLEVVGRQGCLSSREVFRKGLGCGGGSQGREGAEVLPQLDF